MTWMPIESAPSCGRFLVYGGTWVGDWSGDHDATITLVHRLDSGDFDVADTEYYAPHIVKPTHWAPLPTAPGAGE